MLKFQYKVSIIVAVYNVEKYIRRCIDSLLCQTYPNIEVILVDDGSPDKCGLICDEYAAKDSRVKVIHKLNGGVSTARQAGLDAAAGDFIIHADPDDWTDPDMIFQLTEKAIESSADMVTCDFYYNGTYRAQSYQNEKDLLRELVDLQAIFVCWNVLVRRNFILQHNIRFSPEWLCYSEDFLFICRLLKAGATVVHLPKAFYHYCIDNENSLVHKKSSKQLKSLVAVITEMESFLNRKDYDNFYIRKKLVLHYAFDGRFFKELKSLYPDIHNRVIEEGQKKKRGNWDYFLAVALSGKPYKAIFQHRWLCLMNKIKKSYDRK